MKFSTLVRCGLAKPACSPAAGQGSTGLGVSHRPGKMTELREAYFQSPKARSGRRGLHTAGSQPKLEGDPHVVWP